MMKFIAIVWAAFLARVRPGLDQREAGLHEHDQEAREQGPHHVRADFVLAELVAEELRFREEFVVSLVLLLVRITLFDFQRSEFGIVAQDGTVAGVGAGGVRFRLRLFLLRTGGSTFGSSALGGSCDQSALRWMKKITPSASA